MPPPSSGGTFLWASHMTIWILSLPLTRIEGTNGHQHAPLSGRLPLNCHRDIFIEVGDA